MTSLLSTVGFYLLDTGYEIGLDWLGQIVKAIVEGVGIIGVGIIVFTLVLKAITLPFDIYQRVKMRKQTLIMREMQPELEKLQKQYANDKQAYQQKMMELYKKNGYSMLGACLPMIISLVILIVSFAAFRSYSNYANLAIYEQMSVEYNAAILVNSADGVDYTLQKTEDGKDFAVSGGQYTLCWTEDGEQKTMPLTWQTGGTLPVEGNGAVYTMIENSSGELSLRVREDGKYLYYEYNLKPSKVLREYKLDLDVLAPEGSETRKAIEDLQRTSIENNNQEDEDTFEDDLYTFEDACKRYVSLIGANAAAEYYRAHSPSFLWVNNVWSPDVSYNHPIQSYSDFQRSLDVEVDMPDGTEKNLSTVLTKDNYNDLTRALEDEKSEPNGYFILIILSIGLMVLSQFLSMRSSKESSKYQSVDGQGLKTQKIMLVIMPIMYAIFAFLYSAAFSVYMCMSSIIAILVTVLSNLILGKIFKKKEEEMIKEKYTRVVPWKKQEEDKKGKKSKKEKKNK